MTLSEYKPVQLTLALEGEDPELDRALGRHLDRWHQAFVTAKATGLDNQAAVHAADAAIGRPKRTDSAAKRKGSDLMNDKNPMSADVKAAIPLRAKKAAIEAELTEAEFYAGTRLLMRISLGQEKIRKTFMSRDEDGEMLPEDIEIYDPNLSSAGKALELIGKARGMFTDNLHVRGAMTHEQALDELDDDNGPE